MNITFFDRAAKPEATAPSLRMEVAAEGEVAEPLRNSHAPMSFPPARTLATPFPRMRALVRLWQRRSRERTELAQLGVQELRDIGLSDWDAKREAASWFWQE